MAIEQTRDVAYVGTLRVSKRCQNCNTMIESGTRAVIRHFSKTWFGWQAGGFLGESKHLRTHACHIECARQYPIMVGRATTADIRGLDQEAADPTSTPRA
jgi:hypothetical protein